jgi:hypothetical protein
MTVTEKYNSWLGFDEQTKDELLKITDPKEIEDRFYKELGFGTGGLRGVMVSKYSEAERKKRNLQLPPPPKGCGVSSSLHTPQHKPQYI